MRDLRLQIVRVVELLNKPSRRNPSEMEVFQMLEVTGGCREDAMVSTIKRRQGIENETDSCSLYCSQHTTWYLQLTVEQATFQ